METSGDRVSIGKRGARRTRSLTAWIAYFKLEFFSKLKPYRQEIGCPLHAFQRGVFLRRF